MRGLLLITLIAGLAWLPACSLEKTVADEPEEVLTETAAVDEDHLGEEQAMEYICAAETKEEAERIAKEYGLEMLEYRRGLVLLRGEKDVAELRKVGKEKKLPPLSLNFKRELHD